MENRIEVLRSHLDALSAAKERGPYWFVDRHMFAVSGFAALLAQKRGLDPELSAMIGLLHDIHTLLTDSPKNHAAAGARRAGEILDELGIVTVQEREIICTAIRNHSSKGCVQDAYSELIKDADVLGHAFFNPLIPVEKQEEARFLQLKAELGLRGGTV